MKSKGKEVTAEVLAFRMNWSNEQDELLQEQEGVIENGRAAFEKVASALAIIKEKELFLLTHTSFKSYCEERWGFTRQWAYKVLKVAEVDEVLDKCKLSLHGSDQAGIEILKQIPTSAKAKLDGLSEAKVKRVARAVSTAKTPPTTKEIEKVVAEVVHKEVPKEPEKSDEVDELIKERDQLVRQVESLKAQLVNQPVKPKLSVAKAPVAAEHPVLIALDNAWAGMTRGMAYTNPTPLMVYKALRNAVEKVL